MSSSAELQTKKDKLNAAARAYAEQRIEYESLNPNDKIGLIRLRAECEEWAQAFQLAQSFVTESGGKHYYYGKPLFENGKVDYIIKIQETLDTYVPRQGATYFSYLNRVMYNLQADYGREEERTNRHISSKPVDVILQSRGEDSEGIDDIFDGSVDSSDSREVAVVTEQEDETENTTENTVEESDQETSLVSACKRLLNDAEDEAYISFFSKFVCFCEILEDNADLVKGVKNYQKQKPKYRVFSTRDYLRIIQLYFPADTIYNVRIAEHIASYDDTLLRIFSQPYIVFLRAHAKCVVNEATAKAFIDQNRIGTIHLSRFRRWITADKIPAYKYQTDNVFNQFFQLRNLSNAVQFYRGLAYIVFENTGTDEDNKEIGKLSISF